MSDRIIADDGFGNVWRLCEHNRCGLQVVRPGKVQCWCDDRPCPRQHRYLSVRVDCPEPGCDGHGIVTPTEPPEDTP